MRRAGADHVVAPYNVTGHQMAKALLKPHVQQFLEFTTKNMGLDVGIEQVRVAEGCPLAERRLDEVHLRRAHGVIVLAIRKADGRMFFNPPADAEIHGGDFLIAMGQPDGLRRLEQLLMGVPA
jgi:voltage-gated potassium channel